MRLARFIPGFMRPLARLLWLSWHRPKALSQLRRSKLVSGEPHRLPGELVVSLTSYPPRYPTLHLTLRSLLAQRVRPDRLILWIAHHDMQPLPGEVRELERHGLEIRACDDLKSFKKLIPSLEAFPDAFIATADDDLYYPTDWLAELGEAWMAEPSITCHRAHRLMRSSDGRIAPYLRWQVDVQDERAHRPSADLVPTGAGGIFYPPHSLDPRVTDRSEFERLCPHGDDLWFYWCARLAGTAIRKVGGRFQQITWPGSQEESLWEANRQGRNDEMIGALVEEFGVESLGLDRAATGKAAR